MPLHREALAPDVVGTGPSAVWITLCGSVLDREVGAGFFKEQSLARRGGVPIHNWRQLLDIDADRVQCVFGYRGAVGEHHRDRLADIANLSLCNDRLMIGCENRQRLQPYRDPWHWAADLHRSDDGVHAGECQGCGGADRANAPVRLRATQNGGGEQSWA